MGGRGSTRWAHRINRETTIDLVAIWASRVLRGMSSSERSTIGHLPATGTGPLDFIVEIARGRGTLHLFYSVMNGGILEARQYSLWLLPTEPHYGGRRWWF